MRSWAGFTVGVLLAGAFYMVLIDTVDLPELYAAIGGVLLAGAAYEAARRQGVAEARVSLRWLSRAWRVIASIPRQIAWVSWQALAQLVARREARGTLRAVPFRAGGEGSSDAGRRALAEGLGSLAPNTIVIGIDGDSDLLLVHQLHRSGGREELDVLELG
jgi:multisubunit Na+/H+ antiporter MnhE subunit